MYGTSLHIHSQHGSGAVIASQNTGIVTCCLVERRAPRESVERRAPGDAGVKPVKRKRSSRPVAAVKLRSSVGNLCGSTAKPEEQMAAAIQQSNVRLQQPGTMATILQAERDDLARDKLRVPRRPPHRESPEMSTQE